MTVFIVSGIAYKCDNNFLYGDAVMTTLTFDTHEFVTELKQAGLSESQAEAITRLHQQAANATIDYVKHEHSLSNVVGIGHRDLSLDLSLHRSQLFLKAVRNVTFVIN